MEIKFKFINEQSIKIIGVQNNEEHEIGCIFTPSSSAENITNAIQICGFSEAFDFWGCARYVQPRDINNTRKRICDALEHKGADFVYAKDIQLMFNFETIKSTKTPKFGECFACFNNPCTCENKGNHKKISPYNVKREEMLKGRLERSDKFNKRDSVIYKY